MNYYTSGSLGYVDGLLLTNTRITDSLELAFMWASIYKQGTVYTCQAISEINQLDHNTWNCSLVMIIKPMLILTDEERYKAQEYVFSRMMEKK